MFIIYIIIIFSFILDGNLTNFLSYGVDNLSLFTPLTTLVSIVVIYTLYYHNHNDKKYFIISFIVGFLYDLFYTNLLFVNAFLFLLVAYLTKTLYSQLGDSYLKNILYILITIIVYESVMALFIVILNLVPIDFSKILYKISHSLILNLIYSELIYIIIKFIPKKYVKTRIN